jgi:Ca-activated chloride channel family protein
MRSSVAILAGALLLAALPAAAQQSGPIPYQLIFDPNSITQKREGADNELWVRGQYRIRQDGEVKGDAWKAYKVLVKENDTPVKLLNMPQPVKVAVEDLSIVLAMDISGSMNEFGRIQQARKAANAFFSQLPAAADCGLILFDHELKVTIPPTSDRGPLLLKIEKTEPSGGTAYLDAAKHAIQMLKETKTKGKAAVIMTDGVDLNSRATLEEVIKDARDAGVKVFTIGIGEPGKNDWVSTVLALDKSGSMLEPADDNDKILKIDALKTAADRFIEIMRSKARATLLDFSDHVRTPEAFIGNKAKLQKELQLRISQKTAGGETAFLDAAYTAVATLMADNHEGKRAVVVLTDGVDNSSRRRKEEVIKRAKDAKIAIHMLGLGRKGELDEDTMKEIAKATGGRYYHAGNQKKLLEIFENLSIQLHDDGIDEDTLKILASQTGGEYYPAKDVQKLKFILGEVTKSVQETSFPIAFKSRFQAEDGTVRTISLSLVERKAGAGTDTIGNPSDPGGEEKIDLSQFVERQKTEAATTQVGGVVVAEMNYGVYLVMLGLLGVLLALPPALRRMTRGAQSGSA